MKLGDRIIQHRTQLNITAKALSSVVGIDASYLSHIENNKKIPALDVLQNIAKALNTTVSELIGEAEPSMSPELRRLVDSAGELTEEQLKTLTAFIDAMK